MINLKVDLDSKVYPLFIGIDILPRLGEIYQLYGNKTRAALITDLNLKNSSYFKTIQESFEKINVEILPVFLTKPPGVEHGMTTVQQVADQLMKQKFKSNEILISLGGSRIGNISAFVSKVIYGGIIYFQVPSTLSAQVYQSIDPNCYLNSGSIRNLYSLKYERNLVWNDIYLLRSLSQKSIINGLGFVIQSACLLNNGLFEFLEKNLKTILDLELGIIEQTVNLSCQNRIGIFRQRSANPQNKLNGFGEFLASLLIESTPNGIEPGESLLAGMLIEGIVAFRQGIFSSNQFERFYQLLKQIPFSQFSDPIDQRQWIESVKDKISRYKLLSLSLPQEFGKFTSATECKQSDLISAIELVFSN